MSRRIVSSKVLEFNVPIRPLRQGVPNGSRREMRKEGERGGLGAQAYTEALKMYAKMAVAEQGWEKNNTDALYIVAIVNMCPTKYVWKRVGNSKRKERHCVVDMELMRSKKLLVGKPDVNRLLTLLSKALKGIVFEKYSQLVGVTVVRRYNVRDGVDVLVGAASDWGELIYDLRNA